MDPPQSDPLGDSSESVPMELSPSPHRDSSPTPDTVEETSVKRALRKRKRPEDGHDIGQPRPLKRVHEACAECRRKKIKCDAMFPTCSACEAGGIECNQEDRHRQTLRPRGYIEFIETQIHKCVALLCNFIPAFELERIDYHLGVFSIDPESLPAAPSAPYDQSYHPLHETSRAAPSPQSSSAARTLADIGIGHEHRLGLKYSSQPVAGSSGDGSNSQGHPPEPRDHSYYTIVEHLQGPPPKHPPTRDPRSDSNVPGSAIPEPLPYDLSDRQGLIKAFSVSRTLARSLEPVEPVQDDVLAGLAQDRHETSRKINLEDWIPVPLKRNENSLQKRSFFLPCNRDRVTSIINNYFDDLNPHRPVFIREEFTVMLDSLYDSLDEEKAAAINSKYVDVPKDSGFLCSVYLVLALGTLCEENKSFRVTLPRTSKIYKNWPHPEIFYQYAISLKPDLPNSITTLQAFILLHWYLYTERHGKGVWRIVGNLVRLAVELGLHRDPNEQRMFSPKECQLRMRLWSICVQHDRDTSLLFGRPLAIQRADFNTPAPSRYLTGPGREPITLFSEHFDLSLALGHIQAEVVNSLYRSGGLSGEQVVLRAIGIERSLEQWRLKAPKHYQKLFVAHSHLRIDQRRKLLTSTVTPECGITMLKYGVLRMCVLRSVFNNVNVSAHMRYKTLHDAVIVAHNVLVIHAQLSTYPEVAFFVSPIPICIAGMIILFAVISRVETLAWGLSKEDIQLSLKLYPLFRWRWLRHEDTGLNPLVARLAERVYGFKFHVETGPFSPPVLLDEMYWLAPKALSLKIPPSIQDVWDPPARAMMPMTIGIGAPMHEHRPHLPLPTSLRQQQDRFIDATAGSLFTEYAIASMINIDTSGGAERGAPNAQDIVAALLAHIGALNAQNPQDAQLAPSDPSLSSTDEAAEEHRYTIPGRLSEFQISLRTASGHTLGSGSGERHDVWPPVQDYSDGAAQDAQGDQAMEDLQHPQEQQGPDDFIYLPEPIIPAHRSPVFEF